MPGINPSRFKSIHIQGRPQFHPGTTHDMLSTEEESPWAPKVYDPPSKTWFLLERDIQRGWLIAWRSTFLPFPTKILFPFFFSGPPPRSWGHESHFGDTQQLLRNWGSKDAVGLWPSGARFREFKETPEGVGGAGAKLGLGNVCKFSKGIDFSN